MAATNKPAKGWPSVQEVFDEKYGDGAWAEYTRTNANISSCNGWFELTKLLRFSEKLRCCGNPLGLAKVAPGFRRNLIAQSQREFDAMGPEEKYQREEAIEALANAIDAERFCNHLPVLTGDIKNRIAQVDEFAGLLLMWLEFRGNTVVRKQSRGVDSESSE